MTVPSLFQLEGKPDEGGDGSRCERHRRGVGRKRGVQRLSGHLGRVRQVRTHPVQQRLNTGVLVSRSDKDRREFERDGGSSNGSGHFEFADGHLVQEEVGKRVVALGNVLDQLGSFLIDEVLNLGRNLVRLPDIDSRMTPRPWYQYRLFPLSRPFASRLTP